MCHFNRKGDLLVSSTDEDVFEGRRLHQDRGPERDDEIGRDLGISIVTVHHVRESLRRTLGLSHSGYPMEQF